jgi:hypothetical protein
LPDDEERDDEDEPPEPLEPDDEEPDDEEPDEAAAPALSPDDDLPFLAASGELEPEDSEEADEPAVAEAASEDPFSALSFSFVAVARESLR